MNNEEKIIDYLNGMLSPEERTTFEDELLNDSTLQEEMEQYKVIFGQLDEFPQEKPSSNLRYQFEKMLDAELNNTSSGAKVIKFDLRKNLKTITGIAAILVIGILVGINYNQSIQLQKMNGQNSMVLAKVNANLKSQSVTGRINAVQVSQNLEKPKKGVIKALIKTLKEDESPNVRLAAAEALESHVDNASVRVAMVEMLNIEKDPFVLIALIGTLSNAKDQTAKESLLKLTTSDNIQQFIKDEAHMGLIQLEKI